MGIIISTPHLVLRQLRMNDASILNAILNQRTVIEGLAIAATSLEQTTTWLEWAKDQYEKASTTDVCVYHAIMEKDTNTFVGLVGMKSDERLNNEIIINCSMLEKFTNLGYATEAIKMLAFCGFKRLEFDFITAIVLPNNVVAQRVCEKCGFQKITTKEIATHNQVHKQSFYYYKLFPNI